MVSGEKTSIFITSCILAITIIFVLILNSYNYNCVYIPYYFSQKQESENDFRNNEDYFNSSARAFVDKYGEMAKINDNEMEVGEIYYFDHHSVIKTDNGTISPVIIEKQGSKQKPYTFTKEQVDAIEYILTDLNYSFIKYYLFKNGRYYMYFCKDSILRKPFFSFTNNDISDDILNFGIVYSSDEKGFPPKEYLSFHKSDEQLSQNWFMGYGDE